MIKEEGYLVINRIDELRTEIYGPTHHSSHAYFGSNGLRLFPNVSSARSVVGKISRKAARVSKLRICVAENEVDLEHITSPYILMVGSAEKALDDFYLAGPYVDGSIRLFDSCSYLTENGLYCFDDLQSALYSLREAARQSQCLVSIASFDLEEV